MKALKVWLTVIPCLIIAVLVIVALPKKEVVIYDEMGDADAFDEPTHVTNSELDFFTTNDQLLQKQELSVADEPSYFTMSDAVVSTDYNKNNISILPDLDKTYTGPKNVVLHAGLVTEYEKRTRTGFILKGGKEVDAQDTFEIILSDGVLGSGDRTPHRLSRGNIYYAAFTTEKETIYFELTTSNEFLSVALTGLKGRVEYTLFDADMVAIKNGWNNSQGSIDIQYKGAKAARYYLKVKGSYQDALTPFCIKPATDDNEWLWQMVYSKMGSKSSGRFDYYGDEDYFVLPSQITSNINKSVIRFDKADVDMSVVAYDKNKNKINSYIYKAGSTSDISLFGLTDIYAISVYACSGADIGKSYSFSLAHTNASILGIETYGFTLSPLFCETEDYYTATVKTLDDKKIVGVMHSYPELKLDISVKNQGDKTVYVAKAGKELPLKRGRNTVTLKLTIGDTVKEITIIITDENYGYSLIDFEYTEVAMPTEYKAKIDALKAAHPNWKFKFVDTGWDFNAYVQSQVGSPSIIQVGNKWMNATGIEIAQSVNPLNFLDEKNIFMFENAVYSKSVGYKADGIKGIWNSDEYAGYILEGAKSTGLSPYFIAARAGLESAYGKSSLSKGTVAGYEGYYNFFGIGAYDIDPLNGGAAYAKSKNWNTKRKALIEGAAWVANDYVQRAQFNTYFLKFCFVEGRSWHQYMTDIEAPKKDAALIYKQHVSGGTIDNELEFIIPVFTNLPTEN